jgi:hypothetical protein
MDRERLARLLGMLGSTHEGEVVNAARLAVRLIREAGLTWPEILESGINGVAVQAAKQLFTENQELRADNETLQHEVQRLRARSLRIPDSWREPQSLADGPRY